MFIKSVFFILLSFVVLPASALEIYEWSVDLNTSSSHRDSSNNSRTFFNEENDGAGFTYGYSKHIDIKAGFFENSYFRTTVYAGAVLNQDFYLFNHFVISPGIGLIFATGYDNTPADAPIIAPIVHPSISFGYKYLRSTIGYIPYDDARVITFQTQFLF